MPDRIFADDPTIPGAERLLRRISPIHVIWDDNGNPNISSGAFDNPKNHLDLSVNLASVMEAAGREPKDAIREHPGFGLALITASHARSLNQSAARNPTEVEPAHGIVYGEKPHSVRRRLRDGAHCIETPSRS
jgi:hypothetical protein